MQMVGSICRRITALAVILTFTGCAPFANNIKAAQVSPLKFQDYSCDQIDQEIVTVGKKVSEVSVCQDSAAVKDAVALLVCPVVLWPVLLLMDDGDNSDELSQLKGELDALEYSAAEKQCTALVAKIAAEKHQQEDKTKKIAKQQHEVISNTNNNDS